MTVHYAVEPFDALSLSDLDGFDFPPIEWTVDGLLPAGALVLMVGRPKAGKSLLSVDLLASVALGEPFLEKATAQGPALYVPAEDSLRLVRDRLWTRLSDERAVPLYVLPADGSMDVSLRLDDAASFARLAATVELLRPRLLVLDPFREFHRKRENESDDMAAVLRPLRQLAHDLDITTILIHHRNKHASDPALATRGSSAITGGVDVVVTLELSDEGNDEGLTPDQTLTMRVEGRYGPRQNLAARLRPGLRWEPTAMIHVDDLPAREKVVRHLEVTGECLSVDDLLTVIGGARSHLQNALRRLLKDGKVVRDGAGTKADAFRYRAASFQATYQGAYEPAYADFRVQTTKTGDSYAPEKVYVADRHIHSGNGRRPLKCRECGRVLSILNDSGLCGRCAGQAATAYVGGDDA